MLAVPALALAGSWPLAAALIVAERTGRAIRRPSIESMLADAGGSIGHGWVFGLNEALDQAGATFGPLTIAFVLYRHGTYRHAFAVLLISALMCLAVLVVAFLFHGRSSQRDEYATQGTEVSFRRAYWLYMAAGAGFADFSLISFHFQKTGAVSQELIPVFYAAAMATGALASLVLGKMLDQWGCQYS